ncbi:SPFH domain-containing protein [Nocardia terpenica]|uniref:SPFH domain-containing protein n=1 Tax=Nocardia terpenica TaxID=455432 RepID=UPI00083100F6|nr:SPFH domain-containing protein [Nocardia terpenica]NQE86673.1 SPFH domain-containing protein [Nocardia terpenica]
MPFLFSLACFIAVVATLSVFVGVYLRATGQGLANGGTLTAAISGAIAVLLFALSSFTIVSTRNVGITTSFGKPTGTLSNGIHPVAPWQKVIELSGTIRTDSQTGGFADGKCDGGTAVRLANNSTACVDNTVRYRIVQTAADELYRDYQSDENIKNSLVTRELNAVINGVFASYNPLSAEAADAPKLDQLSGQVTDKLKAKIGKWIDVQGVIISLVHFDQVTQDKINAYQAQIASTRIAEESQRTAAAQAQANRVLSDSVSRDPNVLVAKCLDLVSSGKALPAGFQCWPGTGLANTVPVR